MFDSFFNMIFGKLIELSHLWALVIIATILTFLVTIVYKYATDQTLMKGLKDETKSLQKQMKEHKDNPSKMMEIQKQAMEKNMKYMMHSFKPMIITFIPIIIIFGWLKNTYTGVELNFLGFIDSWLWTYIIISIIASLILRKFLRVY